MIAVLSATVRLTCCGNRYRDWIQDLLRGEGGENVGRWNRLEATPVKGTYDLIVKIPDFRGEADLRLLRCTEGIRDVQLAS